MTGRTRPHLLDVNVVLALIDSMHEHHEAAWRWFQSTGRSSFATCPIVENGVLRIASSAAYPNRPGDIDVVRSALDTVATEPGFQFWPDSVSLRGMLIADSGARPNEITDLYLVALAASNGGSLATFDTKIRADLVAGATAVEVLRP